jgi:hypothetical protein
MPRGISIVLLFAFALTLAGCSQYGEKLQFGSGEVYYTDGATQEEAQKLGDWLKETGFFADDDVTRSVQLRKEGDVYQVRFVVQPDKIDDQVILDAFQVFADVIGPDVLGGAPAEIHLTDENLETLRVIKPTETQPE